MSKEKIENLDSSNEEQEIIVNDPEILRPVELPLVVQLPEGASKAQIEFAKTLNAYAYKNPKKWKEKKDDKVLPSGKIVKGLITQLRELKNAPDPVSSDNLTFKNKLLE